MQRNKIVRWTLLFAAIMVVAWLLYRILPLNNITDVPEQAASNDEIVENLAHTENKESAQPPSPEELLAANPRLQKKKQMQQAANREMNFYGKVVDQYGEPVSGAEVEYRYAYYPNTTLPTFSWSVKNASTTTDSEGVFRIENTTGVHLTIAGIQKQNYDVHAARVFRYRARTVDDKPFQSDPANPVVFQAWKKEHAAQELKKGEERFTIPANGERHIVALPGFDKSVGIFFSHASNDEESDARRRCCWVARLAVENGGIVEASDVFMYEAPETGYQSEWETNAPEHQNVQTKFYLRGKGGEVYGRVEIYLRGYYGDEDKGFIEYKYWVNPTGSRNLLPADE